MELTKIGHRNIYTGSTLQSKERHVSYLAHHYFTNARKMIWSCDYMNIYTRRALLLAG